MSVILTYEAAGDPLYSRIFLSKLGRTTLNAERHGDARDGGAQIRPHQAGLKSIRELCNYGEKADRVGFKNAHREMGLDNPGSTLSNTRVGVRFERRFCPGKSQMEETEESAIENTIRFF